MPGRGEDQALGVGVLLVEDFFGKNGVLPSVAGLALHDDVGFWDTQAHQEFFHFNGLAGVLLQQVARAAGEQQSPHFSGFVKLKSVQEAVCPAAEILAVVAWADLAVGVAAEQYADVVGLLDLVGGDGI